MVRKLKEFWGSLLFRLGRLKRARRVFESLDNNTDWVNKVILAHLTLEMDDLPACLRYLDEGMALVKEREDYYGLLTFKAKVLINLGQQEEVLALLDKEDQSDEEILSLKAGVAISINDLELAEGYAKQMQELNPQSETALGYLGGIYYKRGNYPEALKNYQALLECAEQDKTALGGLVACYIEQDQLDVAEEYYAKLESKYKGDTMTLFNKAKLEYKKGNTQDAYDLLKFLEPYVHDHGDEHFFELYEQVKAEVEN